MVITGPTAANLTPNPASPAAISSPTATIAAIHFDLIAHTYTINYTSGRAIKSITDPGFQSGLEAAVQALVEGDQGWTAGSSTITSP